MHKSTVEVVVISLATAKERRRKMTAMLEGSCLNWSYFDAHKSLDNAALRYVSRETKRRFGRALAVQEIAVYSSQFTVLQQFLDRNSSDFVLVLEDDVIFDINFPLEAFSAYCAERNIDYIRLFGKHFAGAIWLGFFFDRSIIRYRTSPAGAQAYLMSKQGAKLFTEHFQLIDATVDLAMDRFWESQLPIYSIFPYPIIERYSPTSIPIPSTHEALGAEDRFAWNCHRALGKAKKIYANITLRTVDARMKQKSPEFRQVFDSA